MKLISSVRRFAGIVSASALAVALGLPAIATDVTNINKPDNRYSTSSTCFGPSASSVMDKVKAGMTLTAEEQAIASQCQSMWQEMQQQQEQKQKQAQQAKAQAEAEADSFSKSNASVQSAIKAGDQNSAQKLVSNHLQSIGFSPDVSNAVSTSVVSRLSQANEQRIELDQSNRSKTSVFAPVLPSAVTTQLVAPPVGNYSCLTTVGQLTASASAPAEAKSKVFGVGASGAGGDGNISGSLNITGGSSFIKGVDATQGLALIAPCSEQQRVQTVLLQRAIGGNIKDFMFQPNGGNTNNIGANVNAAQQQVQAQQQGSNPDETAWK